MKSSEMKKGFSRLSTAWYAKANPDAKPGFKDEILIGFYDEEGGTAGEFAIRWFPHGAKLEAYDDSWKALWQFRDLIEELAALDSQDATPDEVEAALLKMGYKNMTPLVRPQ